MSVSQPGGPHKTTMTATQLCLKQGSTKKYDSRSETFKIIPFFIVTYKQNSFNVNKALRANSEDIKKMTKQEIHSKLGKYISSHLNFNMLPEKTYGEYDKYGSAYAGFAKAVKKFS